MLAHGELIVFVPSLGRTSRDFARTAAVLRTAGFRIESPETRPLRATGVGAAQLTYSDWATDLAHTITVNGFERAVVVGHAAGSRYARALAAEHPELVSGLVLAAAASAAVPVPAQLARALDEAADANLDRQTRLAGLQTAFFAPGHDPSEWLTGWSAETHHLQRITIASRGWSAVGDGIAILDLQGDLDPWRPAETRDEMARAYGSRVTVRVIADASHALFDEQPDATATAIAEWLRSRQQL